MTNMQQRVYILLAYPLNINISNVYNLIQKCCVTSLRTGGLNSCPTALASNKR